ncbi:MAG: large conductance mechanosensitive channel protein MscL [Nitriliruptoraceae bacterium]|nr:large conductance mechanosensitive channel protein MscL [Nitriliruptoraceae bacterium]
MIAEFREFINRGNFIELAVGFVMGVTVTTVVQAVVNRLIMPAIGLLFGEANFDNLLTFGDAVGEDGVPIGSLGAVLTALVNFLLVALVLFLIVKAYNRMQRSEPAEPEPEADPEDVVLLREIRDALTAGARPTDAPSGSSAPPNEG